MTSALGIASVSVVLVDLLNNGLIDHDIGSTVGGRVAVSALPPDRVLPVNGTEATQLNLFLHHVTPNLGWRNAGQPTLNGRGERVSNPPLALNLHYLLSAYGEKDFYAEILLGFAMQLMHEHPVLSRADIAKALAPPSPSVPSSLPESLRDLSTSELADQVELVKITPEPLSTEEISKIWTAFQSHYRSTAAYEASVVLLESKTPTRPSLPVRERNVHARPLQRPVVDAVVSSRGDAEPILASDTILVRGHGLAGEITHVTLGDAAPAPSAIADAELAIPLAGTPLRAGIQPLRVVHELDIGTPPRPHRGAESDPFAFPLAPALATAVTKTLTPDGAGLRKGTLFFDVTPPAASGQHAVLLLNELLPAAAPPEQVARGFSFPAAPLTAGTASLSFAVSALPDATYLVRVRVDGVESPIAIDPATGRFDTPKVAIP
ncbi:MAG TPA: DUF4255 domain-containing protein [Conexibacter sp.]